MKTRLAAAVSLPFVVDAGVPVVGLARLPGDERTRLLPVVMASSGEEEAGPGSCRGGAGSFAGKPPGFAEFAGIVARRDIDRPATKYPRAER